MDGRPRSDPESHEWQAMAGAASTLIGVGVAAGVTALSGGAAAPFAPMIAAGTSALLQGTGTTDSLIGGFK